MPLYEYRCLKCHRHFEVIQKFSDPPLKNCQFCGGKIEKLIFPPAIHFKGTGWYVTDYAKRENPKSEEKSKEDKKLSPIKGSSNKSCLNGSLTSRNNNISLSDSPAKN